MEFCILEKIEDKKKWVIKLSVSTDRKNLPMPVRIYKAQDPKTGLSAALTAHAWRVDPQAFNYQV